MNEPLTKPDWLTPEVLKHLKRVQHEYEAREFGEEMARINALPVAIRRKQIAEMMDHAIRKGVKFSKPALGVTP